MITSHVTRESDFFYATCILLNGFILGHFTSNKSQEGDFKQKVSDCGLGDFDSAQLLERRAQTHYIIGQTQGIRRKKKYNLIIFVIKVR